MRAGLESARAQMKEIGNHQYDPADFFGPRDRIGTDYLNRAMGVYLGIFGNDPPQSVYLPVAVDSCEGELLDGSKYSYTVTFDKDQIPPVSYFWSLTMYNVPDRYLVGSPVDRYANGDSTPGLKNNDDGLLTVPRCEISGQGQGKQLAASTGWPFLDHAAHLWPGRSDTGWFIQGSTVCSGRLSAGVLTPIGGGRETENFSDRLHRRRHELAALQGVSAFSLKEIVMWVRLLITLLSALYFVGAAQAGEWPDRTTLPIPLAPFEGKIGPTYKESEIDWQEPVAAPENAPNVIVILLDDVGFGQTSTFGGLIPTPNLDQLAGEGLRYNRFHTTAICGPSRAALLTGRNHHSAGNGFLMEWATGFPSYSTMLPRETATVGEILKGNGYTTWWYGKNHNTPDWETTVAGPFDRWPTGMGFDYFYGFNAGETHQYYPVVFENTTPVEPDKTPEEGEGAEGEIGKGADIALSVNGAKVAGGSMPATVPGRFGIDTFGIGEDSGQPVTHAYQAPFRFNGVIEKVVVDVR